MATTRRNGGEARELRPRLIRLAVAARYLSMSCGKLRLIIQRGELSVIKSDGTSPWLIDIREIDAWIEANKVRL
jgi:hypothetical protein